MLLCIAILAILSPLLWMYLRAIKFEKEMEEAKAKGKEYYLAYLMSKQS